MKQYQINGRLHVLPDVKTKTWITHNNTQICRKFSNFVKMCGLSAHSTMKVFCLTYLMTAIAESKETTSKDKEGILLVEKIQKR